MKTHPIIRTIYLYLFALVGLAMTVIGLARLVDIGLKQYIFTKADEEIFYNRSAEPPAPKNYLIERGLTEEQKKGLSEEQKKAMAQWEIDYSNWQAEQSKQPKIDYRTAQTQRNASSALSMILVGLPLYLYHWSVIKRDKKEELKNS